MRTVVFARAAIASTRAPLSPFSANSATAASRMPRRFCSASRGRRTTGGLSLSVLAASSGTGATFAVSVYAILERSCSAGKGCPTRLVLRLAFLSRQFRGIERDALRPGRVVASDLVGDGAFQELAPDLAVRVARHLVELDHIEHAEPEPADRVEHAAVDSVILARRFDHAQIDLADAGAVADGA